MRTRTDFPRAVREVPHVWIPTSDDLRLAARVWLPEDARAEPVPAILDCIPYRKNDGTVERDRERYPYFAGHGYACVRLDLRGSGDSEGILEDEYLAREQQDLVEVVDWVAAQPWCTGKVGMTGISWGGFNSLQVAALRPAPLKAIITVMSTDDRYADDVHYVGGTVQAIDMLAWATSMLAFNAKPPDPEAVGERWRELWMERLEKTPPYIEPWLSHQRRDDYWQHGSVCEDYGAITCAVYAVGGWLDGYTNAVLRLLEGLRCPRKGLIGPWGHVWPEKGYPAPAIGFLQECLRWWDQWLKEIDTGIMDEPMLRVWQQDWVAPAPKHDRRPGAWVAEDEWPSSHLEPTHMVLEGRLSGDGVLRKVDRPLRLAADGAGAHAARASSSATVLRIKGLQATGLEGGAWCGDTGPADYPGEQRHEDGRSLCFTSAPLAAPLAILGFPDVTLTLESDRSWALVAVRLCDVAPDGSSLMVSRGVLNLTHRDGHERPSPLEPGKPYTVKFRLDAAAHRFPAGHRLRVGLSPTYWPLTWPSPEPVTLTVHTGAAPATPSATGGAAAGGLGASFVTLPVRPSRFEDSQLPDFPPPETAPPLAAEQVGAESSGRTIEHDVVTGTHRMVFDWGQGGRRRLTGSGYESEEASRTVFTIVEGDPLSAGVHCDVVSAAGRQTDGALEWDMCAEAAADMTCDAHDFRVSSRLRVLEGDEEVFARTWSFTIPRDFA